jgi:hypothetical protein
MCHVVLKVFHKVWVSGVGCRENNANPKLKEAVPSETTSLWQ